MGHIEAHIAQRLSGTIWRLEVDSTTATLFVEIREERDRLVLFTSIDLVTGKINFNNLIIDERWLAGIEASYNGVLLLHQYESANTPVHKGLIAIDGKTGNALWSNYNYAFDHLSNHGPVVFDTRIQPRKFFIADINNGATLRPINPSIDFDVNNHIQVPAIFPGELVEGLALPETANQSPVHYMEYNTLRIVSLHTLFTGRLQQRLYVFKGNEMLYEDLLNDDIQKLQPEAFVMHDNHLIYIKNRSEIKAINL
jgi:hypothetical protein